MKAFYDNKPAVIEKVSNGANYYRWEIKEVREVQKIPNETQQEKVGWECQEVIVWSPLSREKITKMAILELWDNDYQQKLINDHQAILSGILPEEKEPQYLDFLKRRAALKKQIETDCREHKI